MNSVFRFALGTVLAKMNPVHARLAEKFDSVESSMPPAGLGYFDMRTDDSVYYYELFINNLFDWLLNQREITNYTFQSSAVSDEYMLNVLCLITGHPYETLLGYYNEYKQASFLQQQVDAFLKACPHIATVNPKVEMGRRVGWYVLVRATKPRCVVETGIDKGLGSCLLSLALLLNAKENAPGKYIGIDINPDAGFLYKEPLSSTGSIIVGDSIQTLSKLDAEVDLIILDSDHTPGYEYREYQAAERILSPHAILISDTAKYDPALLTYARETKREFHYCPEYLEKAWYPGPEFVIGTPKSGFLGRGDFLVPASERASF